MWEHSQRSPMHEDTRIENERVLEAGSPEERGVQVQMAAVSTAITLVLVAAIVLGVWQSRGDRRTDGAVVGAGARTGEAAASSERVPSTGALTTRDPQDPRSAGQTSHVRRVIIVGSAEAAAEALMGIADENRVRVASGMPERDTHVIVAGPDADADDWLRTLAEQDAMLAELGQPTLEIIDLRTSVSAAGPDTGAPSPTGAASEVLVVYLAESEDDATMLRDLRLHSNMAVFVSGTTAAYARALTAIQELMHHIGTDRVQVVDMRRITGGGAAE
ncbi:MAG: hypothetical protein AB7R89_02015 [Dehalococcoidia bacterium]